MDAKLRRHLFVVHVSSLLAVAGVVGAYLLVSVVAIQPGRFERERKMELLKRIYPEDKQLVADSHTLWTRLRNKQTSLQEKVNMCTAWESKRKLHNKALKSFDAATCVAALEARAH